MYIPQDPGLIGKGTEIFRIPPIASTCYSNNQPSTVTMVVISNIDIVNCIITIKKEEKEKQKEEMDFHNNKEQKGKLKDEFLDFANLT